MAELDDILQRLFSHHGVEHLLLVGSDGLLIRQMGAESSAAVEAPAAMTPGVATACAALGRAAGRGEFATAAIELDHGVALVAALSGELLLTIVVRPEVGFAPLLRELRARRSRLAELL